MALDGGGPVGSVLLVGEAARGTKARWGCDLLCQGGRALTERGPTMVVAHGFGKPAVAAGTEGHRSYQRGR
jgi:hypothetical protein